VPFVLPTHDEVELLRLGLGSEIGLQPAGAGALLSATAGA
jgi:hypothetical protein